MGFNGNWEIGGGGGGGNTFCGLKDIYKCVCVFIHMYSCMCLYLLIS